MRDARVPQRTCVGAAGWRRTDLVRVSPTGGR